MHWRYKHTMVELVDIVLKAYSKYFEQIYKVFAGKHNVPGQKPHMEVDEFEIFVTVSGLLNDILVARDISLIFNLSMMSQVDEINKGRHCQATLLEFTEMFCRCAMDASFGPPAKKNEEGELVPVLMSVDDRKKQPLFIKIINCLPTVISNTCDKKFLATVKKPKLKFPPGTKLS